MFGCTFDTWTASAASRSYVLLACVLGYFLPLWVITHSYFSIVTFYKSWNRDVVDMCVPVSRFRKD